MKEQEQIEEIWPYCWWCWKRGGKVQIDPYAQEINNEEIKRRFHDHCLTERAEEI
jgi:hypothetical protein